MKKGKKSKNHIDRANSQRFRSETYQKSWGESRIAIHQ